MSRNLVNFFLILIIVALSVVANLPNHPQIDALGFKRSLDLNLGLDLQGGMQVILEGQKVGDQEITTRDLDTAINILESRANGLGVSEVLFQRAANNRVVGEFPGLTNTDQVINVLKETGQLEFVDTGDFRPDEGKFVNTSLGNAPVQPAAEATPAPTAEATPQDPYSKVYKTILTGAMLESADVSMNETTKEIVVAFKLKPEGAKIFAEHTANNVGKVLAIVLDKKVVSAPSIQGSIPGGEGQITGNFTQETAKNLQVQLAYGALPVAFKIAETRIVGPTLGQDSINKSYIAGLIGLLAVMLFMLIYYRLPGLIADLALLCYTVISLAIFRFVPVTLTLPGIAGFVLSIGMAVDANVLIFERMKEELRAGRKLEAAIEIGWTRAWNSIRDSNMSTLITCAILFWYGSNFGASIVKGFSLTLALGVLVSLFTALFVTRTFLHLLLDRIKFADHKSWFGA